LKILHFLVSIIDQLKIKANRKIHEIRFAEAAIYAFPIGLSGGSAKPVAGTFGASRLMQKWHLMLS
jgi:hypothetical protein